MTDPHTDADHDTGKTRLGGGVHCPGLWSRSRCLGLETYQRLVSSLVSTKIVNVSVSSRSQNANVSVSSRSRPLTSRAHPWHCPSASSYDFNSRMCNE